MRARAVWAIVFAGCALTSKSPPLEVRYFVPPIPAIAAAHQPARARLQLGRVAPGQLLRSRILVRESAVEVVPYETLRWTEAPDVYVRRSLLLALFEGQPIEQALGGAPVLDVEVLAFEEVRRGTERLGRVELRYQLHDESNVLARGAVAIERPARSPRIEDVVDAIGAALHAATSEVAERVAAKVVSA